MTDVEASDKIRPKYDSNDALHKYNNEREKQTYTSTFNGNNGYTKNYSYAKKRSIPDSTQYTNGTRKVIINQNNSSEIYLEILAKEYDKNNDLYLPQTEYFIDTFLEDENAPHLPFSMFNDVMVYPNKVILNYLLYEVL